MANIGNNLETELCSAECTAEPITNNECAQTSTTNIENGEITNFLGDQATRDEKNKAPQKQNETRKNSKLANYAPPSISKLHCEPMKDSKKSVYKTDYEKKSFLITPYRQLLASFNTPLCKLIGGSSSGNLKYISYRDATNFKQFLFEGKGAKTAGPITTSLEKYQSWSGPFTAVSEYMDAFSKSGMHNMKNQQQYLEPLTSSQGKFADCKS